MSTPQFTGMSELWQLAWALQGINRTLDVEVPEDNLGAFDRDRLSGLRTAGHLLSTRLLAAVDPFNEVLRPEHDEALARIAADTGEDPLQVAALLLATALETSNAQRQAEQAADRARLVADRLKANAASLAPLGTDEGTS
jgi:hypothetical protein